MTWTYRDGARSHKVDAKVAGAEFARIAQSRGVLQASFVIDENKVPGSPLYDEFDWNDPHAAHQFRLVQARTLIRDVVFVEPKTQAPLQYYHVPTPSGEGKYEFVTKLVNVPTEFQSALGELLTKLGALEEAVNRLLDSATRGSNPTTVAVVQSIAKTISNAVKKVRTAISKLPTKP